MPGPMQPRQRCRRRHLRALVRPRARPRRQRCAPASVVIASAAAATPGAIDIPLTARDPPQRRRRTHPSARIPELPLYDPRLLLLGRPVIRVIARQEPPPRGVRRDEVDVGADLRVARRLGVEVEADVDDAAAVARVRGRGRVPPAAVVGLHPVVVARAGGVVPAAVDGAVVGGDVAEGRGDAVELRLGGEDGDVLR